jgi:tetratricopeptide (TPR) repeat protein
MDIYVYLLAALITIVGGIITIFKLFLPHVRSKKDFSDLFIYRKAKELQQLDFGIQRPLHVNPEVYKRRGADDELEKSLKDGENVLVIGMPKSGKTRSIYQVIKAVLPDFFVIKVPPTPKKIEQVRLPFLKRNDLVFFDDLNEFISVNFDFTLFLKRFKEKSKNLIVVSTCRSGDEYKSAEDKSLQTLRTFRKIANLDNYKLTEREGEELAKEAGVPWRPEQFLGTPGSVILDVEDMKNRYRNSESYEKSILRACKLLNRANIFVYQKELIRTICASIFETPINESSWIDAITHLKENSLVTRSSIPQIDVYDSTLETVVDDYDPVYHLETLLDLLIRLKDAEMLFYLGNAFYKDKNYDKAEKSYYECLQINHDLAEAHSNLGILLDDLKRYDEAEHEYREAIRINPDDAEAHGNLGILYSQIGRLEEAKKELELAKRLFREQGRVEDGKKVDKLLKSL